MLFRSKERKGVYCFHECVSVYILWFGQVFCQSREVAHPGKGPFPPHNRRRLNRRYFWYVLFSPQDAAPPLQIWSSCDSAPTNSFNHVFVCQRQQITIRSKFQFVRLTLPTDKSGGFSAQPHQAQDNTKQGRGPTATGRPPCFYSSSPRICLQRPTVVLKVLRNPILLNPTTNVKSASGETACTGISGSLVVQSL